MTAAVIYCRISKDIAGEHLGVDRQERLCRDLADRLGLSVVNVLVDNDISAYRSKARPSFEAVVEALKAGTADALIVYHVDRLYRRMGDLERLVEIVEATGVEIHTVAAGDVDLGTASGRMIARMLGAAAQHESERIGERMKAKHDELASRGRAPGGRAPYGYRWASTVADDGTVTRSYAIADDEAAAVRKMADRVLEGASLLAVSRELDAAGTTTREGRPWHHSTVRAVLLNPAVAGLRVHRREVAGPGTWEPVLDRETWEQVKAVLADPARKRQRPARKHILSGLVYNQLGERMNGSVTNAGQPIYTTRMPAQKATQIPASVLEDFVVADVLRLADKTTLPEPEVPSGGGELAGLIAEMDELADLRGRGLISLSEWMTARAPLQERLEAAQREAAKTRRPTTTAMSLLGVPGGLRAAWGGLDFPARREILGILIDQIVVGPATRGRWTTPEERVQVTWKV